MNPRGGVMVIARGIGTSALLAAAAPLVPESWQLTCERHGETAILTGGPDIAESKGIVALGLPTRDPWGLPTRPLALDDIITLYGQHGPAVSQLVGGPYLVADIDKLTATCALNGIMPLAFGNDGRAVAMGTPTTVVRSALCCSTSGARPGTCISLEGQELRSYSTKPDRARCRIDIGRLEAEILHRAQALGSLEHVSVDGRLGRWPFEIVRSPEGSLVALTRIGHRAPTRSRLHRRKLHHAISTAWWQTAMTHGPLYAPILERPALDLLSLAGLPA